MADNCGVRHGAELVGAGCGLRRAGRWRCRRGGGRGAVGGGFRRRGGCGRRGCGRRRRGERRCVGNPGGRRRGGR
ncbi:hypothetical protein DMP11_09975 [Parvibacter caecicola]|nr:hypothetical protein DMP11_09975 [Parvibacter caecicola]